MSVSVTANPPEVSAERAWLKTAIAQFEGPLMLYAARLSGEVEQARDAVQETFLRLCKQPRAAVEPHLAEWLYTVCRRCVLDCKRKDKRMRPMLETPATEQPSAEAPPLERLEQNETLTRVLGAVAALPAREQEILRLKFQHGLSYKEISHITTLSVTNVGFLIHQGLEKIRRHLLTEAEA